MQPLHALLGFLLLALTVGGALWGVADFRRGNRLSPAYDRGLWAMQALLLAQVALGVAATVDGPSPPTVHVVAGSLASLLPPAAYLVARGRRTVSLWLAASCAAALAACAVAILVLDTSSR